MSLALIQTDIVENTKLHIASIIVQTRAAAFLEVKHWLRNIPGVEIHAESPLGKLVVVLETETERVILDLLDSIAALPGVLNAALVYHEILSGELEQP